MVVFDTGQPWNTISTSNRSSPSWRIADECFGVGGCVVIVLLLLQTFPPADEVLELPLSDFDGKLLEFVTMSAIGSSFIVDAEYECTKEGRSQRFAVFVFCPNFRAVFRFLGPL